jgi:hypothetical protein
MQYRDAIGNWRSDANGLAGVLQLWKCNPRVVPGLSSVGAAMVLRSSRHRIVVVALHSASRSVVGRPSVDRFIEERCLSCHKAV